MKKIYTLLIILLTCNMLSAQNTENKATDENESQLKREQLRQQEELYMQKYMQQHPTKSFKVAANTQDSLALVAFYKATGGQSWTNHTGWLSSKVADWYGITLDQDGRVSEIKLSKNRLWGTVPTKIGQLTNLTYLDLSENRLIGHIPQEIKNLTKLKVIYLYSNDFEGNILDYLPSLIDLEGIILSDNKFKGSLTQEIGNLAKLKFLYLWFNYFSGPLPPEMDKLSKLHDLSLYGGNSFSGEVPQGFVLFDSLIGLDLTDNKITKLPDLSSSKSIKYIGLRGNQLTFEDIEPNIAGSFTIFDYSLQAGVGAIENHFPALGSNKTISVSVGGQFNTYQWYKKGVLIGGATNNSLIINNFAAADTGSYYCIIKNTLVTDLSLTSRPIYLWESGQKLSFAITGKQAAIEGAKINLSGYGEILTNAEGEAFYPKISSVKKLAYSITAKGYLTINDSVAITGSDIIISKAMQDAYSVNFTVNGKQGPLINADISFNGSHFYSDALGMAGIYNLLPGAGKAFSVVHPDYVTKNGETSLINQDLNIQVDMFLTGIIKISDKEEIPVKIFPNPSKGQFTIRFEKPVNEKLLARIVDLQGKTIHTQTLDKTENLVNMGNNVYGTYILQIMGNNKILGSYKILVIGN